MRRSTTRIINRIIGLQIRAMRLERGLTLEDLAEKLDIGPGEIERYEEGLISIHAARLRTIAMVLGCPIDRFFETDLIPS
jgi:transcriptional regulator with XRE-family HTH domain